MAQLHVSFHSDVLDMNTAMNVILPQKPRRSVHEDGVRIPTMYLLHGMSDNYTAWLRWTSVERYAEAAGIAVVMPEAGLSWYTDMAAGPAYRRFIGEEVVKVSRNLFPMLSHRYEDTWVAGASMGGYGSMAVGLTYPETFSKITTIAAAMFPNHLFPGLPKSGYIGRDKHYWEDIVGDLDRFEGSENDLRALAQRIIDTGAPKPKIYQWVGTKDFLYEDNVEMRDALLAIGMDLTYEETPDLYHDWGFWDVRIRPAIQWLIKKEGE